MKLRIRLWQGILAAVNAAGLAAALVLTAAGSSIVNAQRGDRAASRWAPPDGEGYQQVSCYFADDAGFTAESVDSLRGTLMEELKNISVTADEGQTLIEDGYSASAGKATIRCDTTGRAEAELTAVGGDFFFFRDFYLRSGSFISDSDLMQDGAVIDSDLAWLLYGSDDIAGQNIYINGTRFYISGVISAPESKLEKKTAGDAPRAYISYEAAGMLGLGDMPEYAPENGGGTVSRFSRITSYECIVPAPVEDFGLNAVKKFFEGGYDGKIDIVANSERFSPKTLVRDFKNLPESVIRDNTVTYPYWENASRVAEYKLTFIYFFRRIALAVPALTLAAGVVYGAVLLKRNKKRMRSAVFSRIGTLLGSIIKRTKKA